VLYARMESRFTHFPIRLFASVVVTCAFLGDVSISAVLVYVDGLASIIGAVFLFSS